MLPIFDNPTLTHFGWPETVHSKSALLGHLNVCINRITCHLCYLYAWRDEYVFGSLYDCLYNRLLFTRVLLCMRVLSKLHSIVTKRILTVGAFLEQQSCRYTSDTSAEAATDVEFIAAWKRYQYSVSVHAITKSYSKLTYCKYHLNDWVWTWYVISKPVLGSIGRCVCPFPMYFLPLFSRPLRPFQMLCKSACALLLDAENDLICS